MDDKILEKFIEDFPIVNGNKKEPYIILFDAYTGMGKSTVAMEMAKYDNSIILNNDMVRSWLNDYKDKSNLKEKLQRYRLELLLENNNSCIVDSCVCHNFEDKIKYYSSLGYKYYIIRLVCNEEIIKERLSKRVLDGVNYSVANYDDYLWMKNNVSKIDDKLIDYVINTEIDISGQVLDFLKKYNLI